MMSRVFELSSQRYPAAPLRDSFFLGALPCFPQVLLASSGKLRRAFRGEIPGLRGLLLLRFSAFSMLFSPLFQEG